MRRAPLEGRMEKAVQIHLPRSATKQQFLRGLAFFWHKAAEQFGQLIDAGSSFTAP